MSSYLSIPAKVRFALYLVALVGGLVVTYVVAEGWLDDAGAALATGILALVSGLAAGHTDTSSKPAVESVKD